jgi:hypothetical protein
MLKAILPTVQSTAKLVVALVIVLFLIRTFAPEGVKAFFRV